MSLIDNEKIQQLRKDYKADVLDETHLESTPVAQFKKWMDQAILSKCPEPNAFTLSTVQAGRPRSRIVLFKGFYQDGLTFFTNYHSHKGKEAEQSPWASMTFFWHELERQIRIEGKLEKVPRALSEEYFQKRPRGSQIGAWASPQSGVVTRSDLEKKYQEIDLLYQNKEIPCPPHWGGYVIHPHYFEFWQGRENRLHDRLVYEYDQSLWIIRRLGP